MRRHRRGSDRHIYPHADCNPGNYTYIYRYSRRHKYKNYYINIYTDIHIYGGSQFYKYPDADRNTYKDEYPVIHKYLYADFHKDGNINGYRHAVNNIYINSNADTNMDCESDINIHFIHCSIVYRFTVKHRNPDFHPGRHIYTFSDNNAFIYTRDNGGHDPAEHAYRYPDKYSC
jgi:hypothetical protein